MHTSGMKSSELFYSDPACDIWYNDRLKAVQTRWKGIPVEGAPFRRILDAIIELLELKKASLIIADARNMKLISQEDQQWIGSSWYPRALDAGFASEILIVSKNSFSEKNIKKIVSQYYDERELKTVYLLDPKDAEMWVHHFSAST